MSLLGNVAESPDGVLLRTRLAILRESLLEAIVDTGESATDAALDELVETLALAAGELARLLTDPNGGRS